MAARNQGFVVLDVPDANLDGNTCNVKVASEEDMDTIQMMPIVSAMTNHRPNKPSKQTADASAG